MIVEKQMQLDEVAREQGITLSNLELAPTMVLILVVLQLTLWMNFTNTIVGAVPD